METNEIKMMKRDGTIIMLISFSSIFIGFLDLFYYNDNSSLTLVMFSVAGLIGGFLWSTGKDVRSVPLFYLLFGTFLALGFIWQGFISKNPFWILIGASVFIVFCIFAYKHKVKESSESKGDPIGK